MDAWGLQVPSNDEDDAVMRMLASQLADISESLEKIEGSQCIRLLCSPEDQHTEYNSRRDVGRSEAFGSGTREAEERTHSTSTA